MTTAYDALGAWIERHFDDEVRFLQALVQGPAATPPGKTRHTPSARRSCSPAWACTPSDMPCRPTK